MSGLGLIEWCVSWPYFTECTVIKLFIFNQLASLFFWKRDQFILFRSFITKGDYHDLWIAGITISLVYKNHNSLRNIELDPWLKLYQPGQFRIINVPPFGQLCGDWDFTTFWVWTGSELSCVSTRNTCLEWEGYVIIGSDLYTWHLSGVWFYEIISWIIICFFHYLNKNDW